MVDRLSLAYAPPGAMLTAFRRSPEMARALIGPIGAGRKICAAYDILLRLAAGRGRRARWLVVAPDTAAAEAAIAAWHAVMPPDGPAAQGHWDAKGWVHSELGFSVQGRPKDLDVGFVALDRPEHKKRFLAAEATGFWLVAARDLDEWAFDHAIERAGAWPLDEPASPAVIMTSRMPYAGHWLQRRAARGDLELLHQPGGRTPQAENLANLKTGFYQRAAAGRGGEWVRRHIDAEWVTPLAAAAAETEPRRIALAVLWALEGSGGRAAMAAADAGRG